MIKVMDRKGSTLVIIIIIAAVLLIAGGIWYYKAHKTAESQMSTTQNASTTSSAQETSTSVVATATAPSSAMASGAVSPPLSASNSSAQVGSFTVVAYCSSLSNNPDVAAVKQINILKGGVVVQTIDIPQGIAPGNSVCPQPQAQDINFDGYLDFMIPSDYGSGGTTFNYWLYDTNTQQFYCPGENPLGCTLINPTFDSASKTITESDELGASDSVSRIYKVSGDTLTLYQETDVMSSGTTTLTTVKQLKNGRMVVVSTSTAPSGN